MTVTISSEVYGTTASGETVTRYTLTNGHQVTVRILDLGGIITSILVPDKEGKIEDVTTGFDTLADYEKNPTYFGALIGRVANRIGGGKFRLDGVDYSVGLNRAPNSLHGGNVGFDKKVWSSRVEGGTQLRLAYTSADGEEGYPGTVKVEVTYELTEDNELKILYKASTDKTTIVNLTSHCYFNLAGHKSSTIGDHRISIKADQYLEKTETGIPSGVIASVEGTPFDLRSPSLLSERLALIPGPPPGFDHNFCLETTGPAAGGASPPARLAAILEHPASGRVMEVYTNQPGLQFYTGNFLNGIEGKEGASYTQHSSLALETQHYPNAINNPHFPSPILRPGEVYDHRTTYRFTLAKQ